MKISKNYLTGGTNSPIPYPKEYPTFVNKGSGPFVYDINGKKFIDMWMGYGALILGHAPQKITEEISQRAKDGYFFLIPLL